MHYSVKKCLCTALTVCLIFSACTMQKSYIKTEKRIFDNGIYTEIPKFKNLTDNEFEKALNEEYEKTVAESMENYLKEASSGEECRFELSQSVKRNGAPIVSVVSEMYSYTGGVHGSKSRLVKNIDVGKNVQLQLDDLFEDSSYEKKLNAEIEKIIESNAEEYHDLWEQPKISAVNREFFYLTDDELVIFYPPYELSYYAKGFVEFKIPYEDIKSYLKAEYKCLQH